MLLGDSSLFIGKVLPTEGTCQAPFSHSGSEINPESRCGNLAEIVHGSPAAGWEGEGGQLVAAVLLCGHVVTCPCCDLTLPS